MMELPGGLVVDQKLIRSFSFKLLTGSLERVICESGFKLKSLPEQVTLILTHALDNVAGLSANEDLVRSLCSGDRLYLMLQLQTLLDPSPQWLTCTCQHCDEKIQFQFEPATMPVKPSGLNFPEATVSLSYGDFKIRVPTGADEESLAKFSDNEQDAMDLVLQQLLTSTSHNQNIQALSDNDLEVIDQKLDEISPQPGTSVSIECPYCSFQQETNIDHYSWISQSTQYLDEDIHTLALNYHWSEKEILALPKVRRKHYLELIQRSQGINKVDEFNSTRGEV